MKTTKWDVFFQLVIIIFFVALVPAIRIEINYKHYSWLIAMTIFVFLLIIFFTLHAIQIRYYKKKKQEETNDVD